MDAAKSVSEKPRVRPRLRLLAPALAAIFIINCLYWAQQPFQPRYPMNGLDPSWVAVLG